MLYFLQRHGIINLSKEDYMKFVTIYKIQKLTSKHLDEFNHILQSIIVQQESKDSLICFIGDELCDRGTNDYFTLKFFQLLSSQKVNFEILISNHSIEFLSCYEKKSDFTDHIFFSGQGKSSDNLQLLIYSGLIKREEINFIVKECYIPHLKLMSYSINRPFNPKNNNDDNDTDDHNINQRDLTIFSHAPIGLDNLFQIASCIEILEIHENQQNLLEENYLECISNLIDRVNTEFSDLLKQKSGVYELFKVRENILDIMAGNFIDPLLFPLTFLIWNRAHIDLLRPKHIFFVHGHDSRKIQEENVCNLDNNLGKDITLHKGKYTALYTHL